MRIRPLIIILLLLVPIGVSAQATDKAEADSMVWQILTAHYEPENWHPKLIVEEARLENSAEKGIYCVKGDIFQVQSLRSDFYVCKKQKKWSVLNDLRFPYETMTNLLLNKIDPNSHRLRITHHQYGNKRPVVTIPMQKLFDILGQHMQIYASITKIDSKEMRAILVFHQKRLNFIHMLEIRLSTDQLSDKNSILTGDLYTNIPQHNIKSIFKEKDQKSNEKSTNEKIPVPMSDADTFRLHSMG